MVITGEDVKGFFTVICFAYVGGYLAWSIIVMIRSIINNDSKSIKRINKDLLRRMKDRCDAYGIPITYHDSLGNCAACLSFTSIKNHEGKILYSSDEEIKVLNKYKDDPYLIAHELGHYIEIQDSGYSTEAGANTIAKEICCSLLDKHEQKVLKLYLNIMFDNTEG